MAYVIYSGEQDIEDNGISISMSINCEGGDKPEEVFIHIADNLLGVSEFITSADYNFADVSIDCQNINIQENLDFSKYLGDNKNIGSIFDKYVKCEIKEPIVEEESVWYNFCLENIKAEMSEDDLVKFSKIFKGVVNESIN